jgi:hypothetical protein
MVYRIKDLIVANNSVIDSEMYELTAFDGPSENKLTFNEWTNNQIRNKLLNQNSEEVSKIKNEDVLNTIAGGLNKVSKKDIAYNNEPSEN